MRTHVAGVLACFAVGCGSPPPAKPPTVEKPVASFADIAGTWVASDDLDFGYKLALQPDGDFLLTLERGKLGRCVRHGKVLRGETAPKFELEISLDECARDHPATSLTVAFPSFTGDTLVVEITDATDTTRRTYHRGSPEPSSVE